MSEPACAYVILGGFFEHKVVKIDFPASTRRAIVKKEANSSDGDTHDCC
jgi:hypothetical protein